LPAKSEGAIIVPFDENPQLKNNPAIIQKNDGALITQRRISQRSLIGLETWHPDESSM